MKNFYKPALLISGFLNLVLSCFLLFGAKHRENSALLATSIKTPALEVPETPKAARKHEATPAKDEAIRPFNWAVLEAEDYHQYIANLRSVSCPEETIREMIVAEVNKRYAPHFAALSQPPGRFQGHQGDSYNQDRMAKTLALKRERANILRDLLGVGVYDEMLSTSGDLDVLNGTLGFLSSEKREQVRFAIKNYEMMIQKSLYESRWFDVPQDQFDKKNAEADLRRELERVLSTDELSEYDRRFDKQARSFEFRLGVFQPTEEEFEELLALKKDY